MSISTYVSSLPHCASASSRASLESWLRFAPTVSMNQEGRVLRHGNAKALPLKSAESLDAILLQEAPDKQNENDPAVANAPPGAAAHAAAACPTSGTNTQAGEGEGETAVAVAVAVAAATAAAAPSPPAAPTRGMDCEGGVCKLVRKKKASATPEQAPTSDGTQEAKTADAAAAPASAPAPARAMDCEGGVCKLVRKNKTPAAPGAAAAAAAPQSAEGGVPEEPLGVGGVMPSLRVRFNVFEQETRFWGTEYFELRVLR